MALEEPTYEVLLTVGEVEFRRYEPYMLAEVTVDGDAKDRSAFKILAGYIFGDNDAAEKMNMTAPVETRGADYAFVMERKYSRESLPQPNDENIRIVERQSRVVAAVRFSGRWTQGNFRKHEQELVEALAWASKRRARPSWLATTPRSRRGSCGVTKSSFPWTGNPLTPRRLLRATCLRDYSQI